MSSTTAIDALRYHGIADHVRARLQQVAAQGGSTEEALARAGCAIPSIAEDPHDRVIIGAALLTEMTHWTHTPRVSEQVKTGRSLLGHGTYDDLHVLQTTFRAVLEEDHAVRVPLPSTSAFLRIPLGGRDPSLTAFNRGVVEGIEARADGCRLDIPRFTALRETHQAQGSRLAAAERGAMRISSWALGAAAVGTLSSVLGLALRVSLGSSVGTVLGLAGLGVACAAWPVATRLYRKAENLRVEAGAAEREARIADIRLRNAEDGLQSATRDLSVARPLIDRHEAAGRAEEVERFVRAVAAPRTDARIDQAEMHVTIAGVRVPRRSEPS